MAFSGIRRHQVLFAAKGVNRCCFRLGVELLLDQTREMRKLLDGGVRKMTGSGVDQAERTHTTAAGVEERKAGVESNAGSADDQRVFRKPFIRQRVLHNQGRATGDGVGTKGDLARSFLRIQAHRRFEPLPVLVHQRHESDGDLGV